MPSPYDASRQDATPADALSQHVQSSDDETADYHDISRFTMSVAEAVLLFQEQGLSLTERTIQRYCQSGKLRALRVDPDTRQPTDKDNYVFLIDPASIPDRISQVRERQEFVSPAVVATGRDESRTDATGRDVSDDDAATTERRQIDSGEVEKENEELRSKVHSLEIDKAVRDEMVKQLKQDREQLLSQLDSHVHTMIEQGRTIGKLETRLALALPEGERPADVPEDEPPSPADGYGQQAVENDDAGQYRL